MKKQALLKEHIDRKQFPQAADLLKAYIKNAEYVDPRDDYTYGPETDLVAYALLEEQGPPAFAAFHEDFLHFFQMELEPVWGHLHKGHFYMRLGLAYLSSDLSKAFDNFEKGYQEDRILCESYYEAGLIADGEIRSRLSPNYASLLIIERSRPEYFEMPFDRLTYFAGLTPLRLEVFWEPHDLEKHLVLTALNKLVPETMIVDIRAAYQEIIQATSLTMMHSLPPLLSAFIRKLLLSKYCSQIGIQGSEKRRLLGISLLELVKLANDQHLLPTPSIHAFLMMVAILEMEMSLKDDPGYTYAIDPVTRMRIGWGLKVLLEKALVSWAK